MHCWICLVCRCGWHQIFNYHKQCVSECGPPRKDWMILLPIIGDCLKRTSDVQHVVSFLDTAKDAVITHVQNYPLQRNISFTTKTTLESTCLFVNLIARMALKFNFIQKNPPIKRRLLVLLLSTFKDLLDPLFNTRNLNQCATYLKYMSGLSSEAALSINFVSPATCILNWNRHIRPQSSQIKLKKYRDPNEALTFLFVACSRVCNRERANERLYPIPKFTISSCSLDNVTNPIWRTI